MAGDDLHRINTCLGTALIKEGLFIVNNLVNEADEVLKSLEGACLIASGIVVKKCQIIPAARA